jgi:hypothetical protein
MRLMGATAVAALAILTMMSATVAGPGVGELRQHDPCNPEIRKC